MIGIRELQDGQSRSKPATTVPSSLSAEDGIGRDLRCNAQIASFLYESANENATPIRYGRRVLQ